MNYLSGIYFIINLINGKIYVGSAINLYKRWIIHKTQLNNNKHPNRHLQFAWNLYGPDAFQFTIVETIENKNQLNRIEQLWIDASDCCNDEVGYNLYLTAGSPLGTKHTEETKLKMSLSKIGQKYSEHHKLKISIGLKGNQCGKGKRSLETRAKMSAASSRKGKKLPEKHRLNISKGRLNYFQNKGL